MWIIDQLNVNNQTSLTSNMSIDDGKLFIDGTLFIVSMNSVYISNDDEYVRVCLDSFQIKNLIYFQTLLNMVIGSSSKWIDEQFQIMKIYKGHFPFQVLRDGILVSEDSMLNITKASVKFIYKYDKKEHKVWPELAEFLIDSNDVQYRSNVVI